jgi:putative phage-type endonuclease
MNTTLPDCHIILPAPYDREEWLLLRQQGIGGSDAAVVMGLSPYKSAYELWLEKRTPADLDRDEPGPDSPMYWGNALEDDVADAFELTTGLRCGGAPGLLANNTDPYLFANPDRLVYDGDELVGILEAKTTGLHMSHEWEGDDLPTAALLQTHHYLMVTGLPRAWVAGLIAGQRFVCKEIEPDDVLHKLMRLHDAAFWERVQSGEPPQPDGSASAAAAVRRRWPEATEEDGVVLSPDDYYAVLCIRDLADQIKELTRQRDAFAQGLQDKLGDHPVGVYDDDVIVRWSNVTTNRIDTTALRAAHPDLADEFTRATHSRRFTTVPPKEVKRHGNE